jgi:exodeoxyribonuclease VII large subunit
MENKFLTVTALNRYIAYKFDVDQALRRVDVRGEISNFRISNNHLYFSLKDENSEIRAIMFASYAKNLKFMPMDGMTVLLSAQVSVYQKNGTYNLNVFEMNELGLGESYLNFLRLKEKLQKEGLFSEEHKLPLPEFPVHVGVITSPTGDAYQDIISTINKRWPLTKVYLYPALVQGTDAPKSLIKALKEAEKNPLLQVLIIARGGGSVEDLSCFNDENLARAVFASPLPIVSGVGHETDTTIIDFVSSYRAPTPTGAAVAVTKDQYQVSRIINEKRSIIAFHYKKILEKKYYEYQNIINRHHFRNFVESITLRENELARITYNLKVHSPLAMIEKHLLAVKEIQRRLDLFNIQGQIEEKEIGLKKTKDNLIKEMNLFLSTRLEKYERLLDKMIIVNPLNLLQKGYVLTYQKEKLLTRSDQVKLDEKIKIKFYDGALIVQPLKKE